jgi:hypothetical protein
MTGVWQSWANSPPKTDRPVLVKALYEGTPVETYKVFYWDKEDKFWYYGCSGGASFPGCKPSDELLKMGGKWSPLIPIEWTEIPE